MKQPIRVILPRGIKTSAKTHPVRVFVGEMELRGVISFGFAVSPSESFPQINLRLSASDGLIIEHAEDSESSDGTAAALHRLK